MTRMTHKAVQADWNAPRNIVGLQQQLDTDDGKSSVLAQLLADEFAQMRKPQSGVIASDSVTVDIGNPAMGLVFGALLVAGTTGGFFLWEYYQKGVDAKAAIVAAQSR